MAARDTAADPARGEVVDSLPSDLLDVVVLGAGLAGLCAAAALDRERRLLVLEREERLGGRILTRHHDGVACDLGAAFGCDLTLLSASLSGLIREDGPVGILVSGRLVLGPHPAHCLRRLDERGTDRVALEGWARRGFRDFSSLPPQLRRFLDAFFHVIHPGPMEQYLPARQADALVRFQTHHRSAGNGEVIEGLAASLEPRLLRGAQVLSLTPRGNHVEIRFRRAEALHVRRARAVICTVPAPDALPLLEEASPRTRLFLEAAQFHEGTVVALGLRGGPWLDFAYVVTPDLPSCMVLQQRAPDPRDRLFLVYFTGAESARVHRLAPADAAREALAAVRVLLGGDAVPGTDGLDASQVRFAEVKHWPHLGPAITPAAYDSWDDAILEACPRVFLAGDYTCPEAGMPYGMQAAIQSGRRAAAQVATLLESEAPRVHPLPRAPTAPPPVRPLVEAWIYCFEETGPRLLGRQAQEAVALRGWTLQAHPDDVDLREWLLRQARDGLWEYQPKLGVTCDDSAIVMEGLLAAGAPAERLLQSVQRLVERFWDEEAGAFHTVRRGRARYWHGPTVDATALAGWLLLQCGCPRDVSRARACAAFVDAAQGGDGGWRGRWFASRLVTCFHAVRLLAALSPEHHDALARARIFLRDNQEADGSWKGLVLDTAAAVRALVLLGDAEAVRRGRDWLTAHPASPGEPVLCYWMDPPAAPRLFVHAVDGGEIAGAWARLALGDQEGDRSPQ